MNTVTASLVVVGLSLIGVLGDYFLKLSGDNSARYIDIKWFVLGLIIFSSTAVGWFFVMKHIKLGTLGVIYGVTTIIALTLVGVFFFKEQLTIYETLGIIAGVTSIILLSRFN